MNIPSTGSQGTTVPITQSTPRSVIHSQQRGIGHLQMNLFGEPRVGMAEAVRQKVRERRARVEESVAESESSLEEGGEDPITLSSSSLEEEEGIEIPSQPEPDDNLESSPPARFHRLVTCSTLRKPTSRP